MTAVIQRVNNAKIYTDGEYNGEISRGLYILLGVKNGDEEGDALLLAEKIAKLRIFSDENGKMNLSVKDVDGEVMIVSNFTLNANYAHGNRPDFFDSAAPSLAEKLYDHFVSLMKERIRHIATGKFGSDMRTEMSTDGPVTIVMESAVLKRGKK